VEKIDQPSGGDGDSKNIGYELINDLRRVPRLKSPNRRSTPDSGFFLKSQESNRTRPDDYMTPIKSYEPRQITKRSKQSNQQLKKNEKTARIEPDLSVFKVHLVYL
jgi:hypothetical protein